MDLYNKIKRNPSNVTPKELEKLLEQYGFELRCISGDHAQYRRAGFRSFPVPISQNPLAIHIVKAALRIIDEIRNQD
jgi:predicted RNA binding protein YcfA (HicA-like mRNA interferase family)